MAEEALILAWVRRSLGSAARSLDERATRHGQTRVARILAETGRTVGWWKRAATKDAARREVVALREVAELSPQAVPAVLDHEPDEGWLLLRHVEGCAWRPDLNASSQGVERAERLGRWRRLLDGIVVPPDPVSVSEGIAARRQGWMERARGLLDTAMLDALVARIEPARFVGERRGLCHRDLDPHNVVWVRGAHDACEEPVVLDFGQARPDHPLVDAVRLRTTVFAEDDAAFDAFITAWRGQPLGTDDRARLDSLLALEVLGTAVWAERHDDAAFRLRAREAWRRLQRA